MRTLKVSTLIGIVLVLLGVFSIVYDQISYMRREKIIDIGPFEATLEKEAHCVRIPVVFGAIVILAGGYLIFLHFWKRN